MVAVVLIKRARNEEESERTEFFCTQNKKKPPQKRAHASRTQAITTLTIYKTTSALSVVYAALCALQCASKEEVGANLAALFLCLRFRKEARA